MKDSRISKNLNLLIFDDKNLNIFFYEQFFIELTHIFIHIKNLYFLYNLFS